MIGRLGWDNRDSGEINRLTIKGIAYLYYTMIAILFAVLLLTGSYAENTCSEEEYRTYLQQYPVKYGSDIDSYVAYAFWLVTEV